MSEPEINSPQEAVAYLKSIHSIIRYLDISDGNMAEGSMRCDANVSVRKKGEKDLGIRTETKNVNSFRFVEKAIQHFETKTKATIEQKAATFVIWFFRGAFEVGTSEWSIFIEQIVQIQKQMEKDEPEKYENRLLAINIPHKEFVGQVKSKINVK